MRKYQKTRIISVIALVIAVVGMTLGFAAFSNTLVISSSATVKPDASTFNVELSPITASSDNKTVIGLNNAGEQVATATISDDKKTLTGVTANFTVPNETITYTFYAVNTGEYKAYLSEVLFKEVVNETSSKVCTIPDDSTATASLVADACDDISISITVDGKEFTGNMPLYDGTGIGIGSYSTIVVKITYKENGARADGEFNISFGDITLNYTSADTTAHTS